MALNSVLINAFERNLPLGGPISCKFCLTAVNVSGNLFVVVNKKEQHWAILKFTDDKETRLTDFNRQFVSRLSEKSSKKTQKNKLVKHSQTNSINESEQVNTNFIPSNEPPVQIASEQNLLAWFRCTFNEIYQRMSEIYKYWVLSKIIFSSLGFACFHGLVEHLFEGNTGALKIWSRRRRSVVISSP